MEVRGETTAFSSSRGIEDMIKMSNLTEEAILKNLQTRYHNSLIYVPTLLLLLFVLFLKLSYKIPPKDQYWLHLGLP